MRQQSLQQTTSHPSGAGAGCIGITGCSCRGDTGQGQRAWSVPQQLARAGREQPQSWEKSGPVGGNGLLPRRAGTHRSGSASWSRPVWRFGSCPGLTRLSLTCRNSRGTRSQRGASAQKDSSWRAGSGTRWHPPASCCHPARQSTAGTGSPGDRACLGTWLSPLVKSPAWGTSLCRMRQDKELSSGSHQSSSSRLRGFLGASPRESRPWSRALCGQSRELGPGEVQQRPSKGAPSREPRSAGAARWERHRAPATAAQRGHQKQLEEKHGEGQ